MVANTSSLTVAGINACVLGKRDGRIQITTTVKETRQLKWWLLGFGAQVEVIKPKRLRDEFVEIARNMVGRYNCEN